MPWLEFAKSYQVPLEVLHPHLPIHPDLLPKGQFTYQRKIFPKIIFSKIFFSYIRPSDSNAYTPTKGLLQESPLKANARTTKNLLQDLALDIQTPADDSYPPNSPFILGWSLSTKNLLQNFFSQISPVWDSNALATKTVLQHLKISLHNSNAHRRKTFSQDRKIRPYNLTPTDEKSSPISPFLTFECIPTKTLLQDSNVYI